MASTQSCNPCDTGVSSLADKSVAFQDILNPLYAEGRVLETWGQYEDFLRYETLFFDVVPQKDPTTGEIYVTYKFKDGLAASSELTLVDNDCKVGWYEPRICGNETVLASDAASGTNVLTVESLEALGGVKAGSTVLVMKKDGNPVNGLYIASIDSANNQITLANNLTTSLSAGDRVRRGAYLRDRNCDTTIDNPIAL